MTITRRRAAWLGLSFLLAAALLLAVGYATARWTDVPLLLSEDGAEWIRPDSPFEYHVKRIGTTSFFRTEFSSSGGHRTAVLTVRAMKSAVVRLDGRVVLAFSEGAGSWKEPHRMDLAPFLTPGRHGLEIVVSNGNGPSLLQARCADLGVATGPSWEGSDGMMSWRPALVAGEISRFSEVGEVPSTFEASRNVAPILAVVFLAVLVLSLAVGGSGSGASRIPWLALDASRVRWAMIVAWGVLAANNILKVPLRVGFDFSGHLEYVERLLATKTIPLATDGWTMYHGPLFYVVSALQVPLYRQFFPPETAATLLRAVPLLCGILQVEVAYRTMKRVFPDRDDLQIVGTVVAGLVPMNIYMSHYISNEPLAALLTAAAILLCVQFVVPVPDDRPIRGLIFLGGVLGLALLTKVSSLLLVPVALASAAWGLRARGWPIRSVVAGTSFVAGVIFLISGWFYVRNLIAFGRPFVSNWDPGIAKAWWQAPGFRTPAHLLDFGEALVRPVYSGTHRVWDSIYSTFWLDGYLGGGLSKASKVSLEYKVPWNYDLLVSGALLGIFPTVAMAVGALRGFLSDERERIRAIRLSVATVSMYVGVLVLWATTIPHYSAVKAPYLLGLLPCFGILAAAGVEPMMRRPWTRALAWGMLSCWAVGSYGAYFVIG